MSVPFKADNDITGKLLIVRGDGAIRLDLARVSPRVSQQVAYFALFCTKLCCNPSRVPLTRRLPPQLKQPQHLLLRQPPSFRSLFVRLFNAILVWLAPL